MKKNSDTKHIGDLINNTIFSEIRNSEKMEKVMRCATIFSFWDEIVGFKFAKFSKPISIKGSKMFVSVMSPVLIQELTLNKKILLNKINSYSKPLNLEIKDIVFNYKNYKEDNVEDNEFIEDKPILIDEEHLKNVSSDIEFENEIEKHISKIKFLNDEQKNNLLKKAVNNKKVKKLQNNN